MGSPNEPPRKIDLKKWDATWERIRAKQAAGKLAAEAQAAAPTMPEHLPPLPPGTRYGGVLDDYDVNGPLITGHVFTDGEDSAWSDIAGWSGTKGCPPLEEGGDPPWHVAIPVDEPRVDDPAEEE